jgi:hypothetical protein
MHSTALITDSLKAKSLARTRRGAFRMKTVSRAPYALSVCAAAAMLAGCGGSAQFPNATAQTPLSRERSDSSGNEVLTGKIHTHCKSRPSGLSSSCKFHTTHPGKATGPYRGTFTADGGYGDSLVGPFEGAYFDESFTIISGSSTITGSISCGPFASASCPPSSYSSSVGNGTAEVNLTNNHLNETLEGL